MDKTSLSEWLTLLTTGLAFATAIVTYFKVERVHVLVNSKMTDALKRIDQLTAALLGSDTAVPDEPSPDSDDVVS